MTLPNIEASLGVSPPVFVRKLVRRSHWGNSTDDLQQRVSKAVSDIFASEPGEGFSVYLVEEDEDLYRVAVALNGNRSSLSENLDLLAFARQEIEACGISVIQSPGETKCISANSGHFDFHATPEQLSQLCQNAMNTKREAARLGGRREMRSIIERMTKDGCHAVVTDSPHCVCENG